MELRIGYFFDTRSFQLVFSTKRERTSAVDWLLLSANNNASHVKYLSSSDLLSLIMEYVWADSKAFTFRMAHSKGAGSVYFFFKRRTLVLTTYSVKGRVSSTVFLQFVGLDTFCALAFLTLDWRLISCPTVTFMVCFWWRRLSFSWSWITRSDDTSVKRRTQNPNNLSISFTQQLRNRKHFVHVYWGYNYKSASVRFPTECSKEIDTVLKLWFRLVCWLWREEIAEGLSIQ